MSPAELRACTLAEVNAMIRVLNEETEKANRR